MELSNQKTLINVRICSKICTLLYTEQEYIYGFKDLSIKLPFEILSALPVLKKDKVRESNYLFLLNKKALFINNNTTSGTSGTPLKLNVSLLEGSFSHAIMQAWHKRISGYRNPKTLYLTGFMTPEKNAPEFAWKDPLTGAVYLSIYSLNKANRERVIAIIRREKPQLVWGYASALYELALLIGDSSLKTEINLTGVVTSEILKDDWRSVIQENLCVRVFDNYGSMEGCHRVLQCEKGSMHINPFEGIIEIVDEQDNLVKLGEVGRVLVTGLIRRHTPLLRYEIGDWAESTGYGTTCSCGLQWPTIGKVIGRSEDMVKTDDGRNIVYLAFLSTKDLPGIKEAQLVQKDYNRFIFRIVLMENENIDTSYLERKIHDQIVNRIGNEVHVKFEYLTEIPRGANGKFKAVLVDMNE